MLGNRFSSLDPSSDDIINHTAELIIRLRNIMAVFFITVVIVIFSSANWFVLDFSSPYRPMIIDILDFILAYATNNVKSSNFLITINSPLSVISEIFVLAIIVAFIIDYPFIIYQLFLFIAPGLYPYEMRIFKKLTFAATALFLFGAAFGFELIPTVTNALVGLGNMLHFGKLAQFYSLSSVINFMIWNVVATGIVFCYPILIISLVFTGVLTVEDLQKRRRHVIAALFGITALITPDPTPISMIILTIPLLFLYEITINYAYKIQQSPDFLELREKIKNQWSVTQSNILEYGNS